MAIIEAELREELLALRKKVVALETAEADNEKLRKELNKLRVVSLEQKSTLELEFMNQLTGVARENSLKLEEFEVRLAESNNINLALSEQLKQAPTPEAVKQQIASLETQHKIDLAQMMETNQLEIQRTRQQLNQMMESRDKLRTEVDDARIALSNKEKEIADLKTMEQASRNEADQAEVQSQMRQLQTSRDTLAQELQDAKSNLASKDAQINSLKQQLQKSEESFKLQLAAKAKEIESLKVAKKTLEIELKHAKSSMNVTKKLPGYHAQTDEGSVKIKELEAKVLELTNELERVKSALASKEYELDRSRATLTSGNASLQSSMEEHKNENAQLKARIKKQEQTPVLQLNGVSSDRVKTLEEEKAKLKEMIRKLESENMEQKVDVARLQRTKKDLTTKYEKEIRILKECAGPRDNESRKTESSKQRTANDALIMQSLKAENTKLKEMLRRSKENNTTQSPADEHVQPKKLFDKRRDDDGKLAKTEQTDASAESPMFENQVNKTSQIIRQLEGNLRKEGTAKQAKASGLKGNTSADRDDQRLMETELSTATRRESLGTERNEATLRHETSKRNAPNSSIVRELKVNSPRTPTRAKTASPDGVPRTPVRGLVEGYEMKISSVSLKKFEAENRSEVESKDVEGLRDALRIERQQVAALEEELTRQCDVNCSLLKEISGLIKETENNRSRVAAPPVDEGPERSKTEVLKIFDEKKAESDRRQIDRLSSELSMTKRKLVKAEEAALHAKRVETPVSNEGKDIDRLRIQVRQLEVDLAESRQECVKFQKEASAQQSEVAMLQGKVSSMEIQQAEASLLKMELERLNRQKTRVEELEIELSNLQAMKSDYAARGDEISGLKLIVESLETSLIDFDASKANLQKEQEAAAELKSTIAQLQSDLNAAQSRVQILADEVAEMRLNHGEGKSKLMNQVESLTKELCKANEQRDEIEANCRIYHTEKIDSLTSKVNSLSAELEQVKEERDQAHEENRIHNSVFDSLRTEIDGKVDLFERTHIADKKEIFRLQSQVALLEKQLEESLSHIEDLRSSLKSREVVEETIENLQRENKHSLDSMINQLQKELTSARISESEKERKLLMLTKEMESMEAESKKKVTESTNAAVHELKQALAEKEGIVERLSNEKEQLILSMNDMTMSRRNEIDELQNELMEMSTRAANQAREIQALKVRLDDSDYRKDETDRLRKRVRELSENVATRGGGSDGKPSDGRNGEYLQVENSTLRQRLRDANVSLQLAEEKMRDLVSEKGGSNAMQVLRDRNTTLKFEVEKLTKKLQRLAERRSKPEGHHLTSSKKRSAPPVLFTVETDASGSTRFMI